MTHLYNKGILIITTIFLINCTHLTNKEKRTPSSLNNSTTYSKTPEEEKSGDLAKSFLTNDPLNLKITFKSREEVENMALNLKRESLYFRNLTKRLNDKSASVDEKSDGVTLLKKEHALIDHLNSELPENKLPNLHAAYQGSRYYDYQWLAALEGYTLAKKQGNKHYIKFFKYAVIYLLDESSWVRNGAGKIFLDEQGFSYQEYIFKEAKEIVDLEYEKEYYSSRRSQVYFYLAKYGYNSLSEEERLSLLVSAQKTKQSNRKKIENLFIKLLTGELEHVNQALNKHQIAFENGRGATRYRNEIEFLALRQSDLRKELADSCKIKKTSGGFWSPLFNVSNNVSSDKEMDCEALLTELNGLTIGIAKRDLSIQELEKDHEDNTRELKEKLERLLNLKETFYTSGF